MLARFEEEGLCAHSYEGITPRLSSRHGSEQIFYPDITPLQASRPCLDAPYLYGSRPQKGVLWSHSHKLPSEMKIDTAFYYETQVSV